MGGSSTVPLGLPCSLLVALNSLVSFGLQYLGLILIVGFSVQVLGGVGGL